MLVRVCVVCSKLLFVYCCLMCVECHLVVVNCLTWWLVGDVCCFFFSVYFGRVLCVL